MKMRAIYQKEWLKLRWFALALMASALVLGGYFCFDLSGQYANIEPESMMWYRFSHLGDKPYSWLQHSFVLFAAVVAACQFIPEVMGKKVRILTHLPVSLPAMVLAHLTAGGLLILLVNGLLAICILGAMSRYYPSDILQVAGRDCLFALLAAVIAYIGLVATIIESKRVLRVLKGVFTLLSVYVMVKPGYRWADMVWLLLIIWLALLVADSFLSVKTRRIESRVFDLTVPVLMALLLGVSGSRLYQEYAVSHARYYLFYSPLLNDFVYQENGPNHSFFYGTTQKSLQKEQFEQALPFVYWKNLDIQGKLPIIVQGESYDKRQIRNARMSLQYDPSRQHKPEVQLYPFFNPISHKGSIRFPENALALQSDRFEVFAAETAQPNRALADEVNRLAAQQQLDFPVREVWGKTTNMKPFDWGYFIKESSGKLFNLRRADNQVTLKPVAVPPEVGDIVYIQVSENRHKQFYGYAISAASQIYLISYPDYRFIPLQLDGFDYQTMSFQLLSDPLYYVMRYNDGKRYSAVRFDKQYQRLDSASFD